MLNKNLKKLSKNKEGGFTLIEILIVLALISALAAIVIVAINPAQHFAQSRNSQRWSNVNAILSASWQYAADNQGVLPSTITTTDTEICGTATCTGLIDLAALTTDEKYIVSIPVDPSCPTGCDANGVGYTISQSANGRITVTAPGAELGETISVTR